MAEGKLWGGRFVGSPNETMFALSVSTQFDWRLALLDLAGSRAHTKALRQAELITQEEAEKLDTGLTELAKLVRTGKFNYKTSDEDVHGALERGLIEILGVELGGKLRAGRSRNDQIATLIRLYLRISLREITAELVGLANSLVKQATNNLGAIMPGRTHLQSAQPILLSHHLLAYAWPLVRNMQRIKDLDNRLAISPYGSAALAGTSLGLDPKLVAEELGFTDSVANSIDGTSSRDLVSEAAFILAQIGVDISRLSEDVILWCTQEFGFAKLDDAWSTGSSIMPQKKNPDVAELARGKAGRLIGNLAGLLTTFKGLPLAYNRDLQEDKEPLFDGIDQLKVLLPAMSGMIATLKFDHLRMRELAPKGYSLATDIADWLVRQRIPFARAHEISGEVVRYCEVHDLELSELNAEQLAEINPILRPEVLQTLTIENAIKSRDQRGGTATNAVKQQLSEIIEQLNAANIWSQSTD